VGGLPLIAAWRGWSKATAMPMLLWPPSNFRPDIFQTLKKTQKYTQEEAGKTPPENGFSR